MKDLSIEEKAYDGNYKVYTELIYRLEDVKNAITKQNYGIAMDILCKPYPVYQITTSTEHGESDNEMQVTWSEEDEGNLNEIIDEVDANELALH